ncbi:MAG: hypothetical protein HOA57_01980 [Candidatus Magasanikbacteria bacterium]|jgi:hypothetical protein|nr:hypothetical protein [Candidatus Magasanikbacteria bacterium]MBT4314684.1 hypothetical protein [Candidatus Magasanikbacteria bacterium]MBT4547263.1 hypothetical protein [Candidatus Magasanikbacteria bacterium]MBT6819124.1 hypothetical protein [Candidatus Magasanikbacteria bacterium]
MKYKEIIKKARELAYKESGKTVLPLFELANKKGQELAEMLEVDKNIVMLGTLFMDLKLKQAMKENRLNEHVQMSLEATKDFLLEFDLDEEIKNKIFNCVEAHHGTVPFESLEAEVCANADCYKFLHPEGIFRYIGILSSRDVDFQEVLNQVEYKTDEKWNILSLDVCKKELEPYYRQFKDLIDKAH